MHPCLRSQENHINITTSYQCCKQSRSQHAGGGIADRQIRAVHAVEEMMVSVDDLTTTQRN